MKKVQSIDTLLKSRSEAFFQGFQKLYPTTPKDLDLAQRALANFEAERRRRLSDTPKAAKVKAYDSRGRVIDVTVHLQEKSANTDCDLIPPSRNPISRTESETQKVKVRTALAVKVKMRKKRSTATQISKHSTARDEAFSLSGLNQSPDKPLPHL